MMISPFPSGCLDSEEENCPGPSLDFSGLHDPEAMLQFLFACDNLLSDGSNDYNFDEEGYNPTQECFHAGHEEHDEGNQLGMPREANAPAPPPHARDPREQGAAQTPAGSHIAYLGQLRELHAKLGEEQQQLRQVLEREATVRAPDEGAHAKARDVHRRIIEDAEVEAPPAFHRAIQILDEAVILLQTMPEPSATEGHRIHSEIRGLLECATI
jgi:hypothetical protein